MITKIVITGDSYYGVHGISFYGGTDIEYNEDFPHRLKGPAVQYINGAEEWRFNGLFHRVGGSAWNDVHKDGSKDWFIHGNLHRIDGPACEYEDGRKSWYLNGKKYKLERNYWKAVAKLKGKVI